MIHQTFNRITTSLILFLLFAFTLTTTVGAANHSPYRPSNPYPIDSATYINTTVTLIWQGGDPNPEDSVVYDVYFGTRYPPPKVSRKQLNTSYHVDNLRYNTVYYWLIVSRDNQGSATAGPLWRFTTRPIPNNPPQQPHSPTPAHQEQNIATPMQLSWECSDQNGDTLYYDIFLEANDTTPDSTLVTNHPYKEISSGILAYNTTYYWQVVATDTHDATNESAIWEFTTGGKNANHPPSEPSNPTPPHP